MLERAVENVVAGVAMNGFVLYAKKVSKGRFPEEINLDLYLKEKSNEVHLLHIKVYEGWGTHYRPWVEFSGINKSVSLSDETVKYFDSALEDTLLGTHSPGREDLC